MGLSAAHVMKLTKNGRGLRFFAAIHGLIDTENPLGNQPADGAPADGSLALRVYILLQYNSTREMSGKCRLASSAAAGSDGFWAARKLVL